MLKVVYEALWQLRVVPCCFSDHAQGFELLCHYFHESHGEAGAEFIFRLKLCRSCSVQDDFEKKSSLTKEMQILQRNFHENCFFD